jgi:chorismate-pyruvate lyase
MADPRTTVSPNRTPAALPLVHPLDDFYAQAGLTLPHIEATAGEEMPEPYRMLLVHNRDMTPTFEEFYGQKIHLRLLRRQQRDDVYFREVVLVLEDRVTPIEFGATKINLALLPPAVRRFILEEREPLGAILASCGIVHTSRPKAFLKVRSDAFIAGALKLREPQVLFGRRNTLFDSTQRPLAEIVEFLPPARSPAAGSRK